MWNTWVEKAKQAAAELDNQLNESVGVEAPQRTKSSEAPSNNETNDVWNDDDFKFDDDEEDNTATATEANKASKEELKEISSSGPSEVEAVALAGSASVVEKSNDIKPLDATAPKGDDDGNAWKEDDAEVFDSFDGVGSSEKSQSQQPAPISPKAKIGIPLNIANLTEKVNKGANEINFMSPFSSLMTSISQDQAREQENGPVANEEDESIPASPMRGEVLEASKSKEFAPEEANESAPATREETKEHEPSASQASEGGAWKEDEIDLGDDDDDGQPREDVKKEELQTEAVVPPSTTDDGSKMDQQSSKTNEAEENDAIEEKPSIPASESEVDSEVASGKGGLSVEAAISFVSTLSHGSETTKQSEESTKIKQLAEAEALKEVKAVEEPRATEEPIAVEEASIKDIPPATMATGSLVSSEDLDRVQKLLAQREEQLAAKAEQMFQLQQMYEKEKQDLQKKVADTKEEAKKRIMKARERCEAAEAKLQASTSALTEDAAQQAQLVAALRQEGEKLAMKQAEMEKTVRAARGEARQLSEQLEDETAAKEDALAQIEKLSADLKSTQEQLSSARKGETQAGKLDVELQAAKEEIAMKENTIMNLEQAVKEFKAENKLLTEEVEATREGAALSSKEEAKRIRKEHNAAVADLEAKLEKSEKEAAVREDQLRKEVEELRKRWQDAVRRADALSVDVQSSTAPLLRQLESIERQNRARASAAAELETKLRAELEETVIQNEKMSKEHVDLKTKNGRLERQSKEQQRDLEERAKTIDELTNKITKLEEKLQKMETEGEKKKEEWAEVERLANEGVAKVRSEMSQSVLESEERYRSQLDTMKEELRIEREKRTQLEQQVDDLLENAAVIMPSTNEFAKEAKPKQLKESEGQAQILESALLGIGDSKDGYGDDTDEEDFGPPQLSHQASTASSYAALEQLTSNLKSAKKELETLRKRLAESEKTRESLVEELGESREAKEKLPLFESKVKELIADNKKKELEIRGLQDDIFDVKEMYRAQLNVLLEEKAAAFAEVAKQEMMNGSRTSAATDEESKEEEKMPELVEDVLGIP